MWHIVTLGPSWHRSKSAVCPWETIFGAERSVSWPYWNHSNWALSTTTAHAPGSRKGRGLASGRPTENSVWLCVCLNLEANVLSSDRTRANVRRANKRLFRYLKCWPWFYRCFILYIDNIPPVKVNIYWLGAAAFVTDLRVPASPPLDEALRCPLILYPSLARISTSIPQNRYTLKVRFCYMMVTMTALTRFAPR